MNDKFAARRSQVLWRLLLLIGPLAGISFNTAVPQESDAIAWNRVLRLADGRVLVSDGAITIEAELAKPRELPGTELPASSSRVIEGYMAAGLPDEFDLGDLEPGTRPETYVAPSGLTLSAKYVEFLRRTVPRATLRMKGDLEPVVIVAHGRAVGLVMAMARG